MEYKYVGTAINPETNESAFIYKSLETGSLFYSPIKLRETINGKDEIKDILLG